MKYMGNVFVKKESELMVRISKNPDERKNEIIEAAHQMFLANGFEETAVSDIVKKVGVAQGTFYYYFKSKDEILDAIIERIINNILINVEYVVKSQELNAVQKIEEVFKSLMDAALRNEGLADYVHTDKNIQMHQKISESFIRQLLPEFTRIVEQGVGEKLFDTEYPEETANFIIYGLMCFHDDMTNYFFNREVLARKMEAFEELVCRCLGAGRGMISLTKHGGLNNDGANAF